MRFCFWKYLARCVKWVAGGFLVAAASLSVAQVAAPSEPFKPYLQVTPVAGEDRVVRVFFSPGCRFSRMYLSFFRNLEATLPADRVFVMTPLVNKSDGIAFAMAFMAVKRYYPVFLNNFIEASMIGTQDKGISTASWSGLDRIGRAAGIPKPVPQLVQAHLTQVERDVQNAIEVRHALGVVNTPSVAVAGTYIVTPEFAYGDAQAFSQLVNGVISMTQ